MAPSLSSSFKSVHARVGWGRDLPVQLGFGVPAASVTRPGLQPGITTLRGDRLQNETIRDAFLSQTDNKMRNEAF